MHKIKNYLLNFLQTQLIITIAAVPILASWGLSLSLMTFVGNLIYSPILTIFIMLSSMVFFTQLLNIPNHWLIAVLDKFTQKWDNVLAYGSSRWLIEFCQPPTLFLVAIPIITFIVLQFCKFKTIGTRICVMTGILTASLLGLWGISHLNYAPKNTQENIHLTSGNKNLDIHQESNGMLTIIDNGFFSRRPSPEKVIELELKPYLVKKFGNINIEQLLIKRPGQRNFIAAKAICTLFPIARVIISPFSEKKLTPNGLQALIDLEKLLKEKKIEFKLE